MREMVMARKEELQKRGVKGFTLMEMLIVVAIIAVLVAIAIPIFTTQLNNAKQQADAANIRSGYALVSAEVLTEGMTSGTYTYGLNSDGTITDEGTSTGSFTATGSSEGESIGSTSGLTWKTGDTPTYTVVDGKITITMG